ncbi:GTPase HflX [Halanaerobiaceae bacterium ANBcell28]
MQEKNRTIIVGANINNQPNFKESMEELENLALACELEVVDQLVQNLNNFDTKYYIGSGKVKELDFLIAENEADIVVFDNELSPSQLRNLEEALEIKIMDRTSLILEIFAKRAQTKEAKIQVDLASLQYMLPRLIGTDQSLSQQTGGVGAITRGAGEKKLELDRRTIQRRISKLKKELESISTERDVQRKRRVEENLPNVALVGYTNAGKSSLMNAMLELYQESKEKTVFEKDMLFATLETSVRSITLPDNKSFFLSDTVGFVNNLPHNLIKAFRSTLQEVREADLLLHVVDYSNPNYDQQIETTNKTLEEIGAADIPVIYVYNKADLTDTEIPFVKEDTVYISATKKIGIDVLVELISENVFSEYIECQLLIPYDQGSVTSYFNENAYVKEVEHKYDGTLLTVECSKVDYQRYEEFVCN